MNRPLTFIAPILVWAISTASASAHSFEEQPTLTVTQYAPVPCSTACAYWDAAAAAGADVCAQPFPAGSYDQTTFEIAGEEALVEIRTRSVWDYDSFVCTDTEPSRLVASLANLLNGDCHTGTVAGRALLPLGCVEWGTFTLAWLHEVNGGVNDRFIVRSYNWSDVEPLPIDLWGPIQLIDDTFEPLPL